MPQVSVVIPCYNAGEYIDEAIHSIFAQSYSDYEIIIVDDGSTEPYTQDKLKSYSHPKLQVIRQENKKLPAARNTGIRVAKGEYILPLDADDYFEPTFLEKAVSVLQTYTQVGVVTCHYKKFGEISQKITTLSGDITQALYANVAHGNSLFRKVCWQEVGKYDEHMRLGAEDWEFWIRIVAAGWKIHCIREYLFHYRIRKDSMYQSTSSEQSQAIQTYIYQKHPRLYQKYFWAICWKVLCLLRKNPHFIKVPYPFVLACRDIFPPIFYHILRILYRLGVLPAYRGLYMVWNILHRRNPMTKLRTKGNL